MNGKIQMNHFLKYSTLALMFSLSVTSAKAEIALPSDQATSTMLADKKCCTVSVKVKCGNPDDANFTDLGNGTEKCMKKEDDARKNREDDAHNRAQAHCNGRPLKSTEYSSSCRTVTSKTDTAEGIKGESNVSEWLATLELRCPRLIRTRNEYTSEAEGV